MWTAPFSKGPRQSSFSRWSRSFSQNYEGRPVSEVLSALLDASGYEAMLRTEGSQERLDNLAELKQSIYEYETTCGEEVTLPHYLNHVALFYQRGHGRTWRPGKVDDSACGQGTGVSLCVPLQHERGHLPLCGKCAPCRGWRRSRRHGPLWLLPGQKRGCDQSSEARREKLLTALPAIPPAFCWRLTRACFPLPSRLRKGCFRRRKTSSATARASFRKRRRPSCRKGSASGTSSSGRGLFWRQTVTRAPMSSCLTGWQPPAKSPSG